MAEQELPQIYLITPPVFEPGEMPAQIGRMLDEVEVACLRFPAAGQDEAQIVRQADALREVAHAHDVPLVIERHQMLIARLGLDGLHLPDGPRHLRKARKALGRDAILGAFCGRSRHDGMIAAEGGADYVSFGPLGATSLGEGECAPLELFQWWSEMIEVPVVAEGGLNEELVANASQYTDFIAFGGEVWSHADPLGRLRALADARRG